MRRREFMKAALAVTVAPAALVAQNPVVATAQPTTVAPGPLPWMKGLDHIDTTSVRVASVEDLAMAQPGFLTPIQMKTLSRLSDVLLPPLNHRPGAVEAQTPQFLDFLIGKADDDIRHIYTAGLDELDTEARSKYGSSFAELETAQVDAILKPRMASWMPEHYPADPDRHFLAMAHHDIRRATRNSEAWARADGNWGKQLDWSQLYWFPVEGDVV